MLNNLGNTQFNADITSTHSDGITVGGTVASYDLADFNTNVARTYATSLTFTQANTFAVNPNVSKNFLKLITIEIFSLKIFFFNFELTKLFYTIRLGYRPGCDT